MPREKKQWDALSRLRKRQSGEPEPPTVVYFIRCGEFIKIGKATNVALRINELQVGNPTRLELLGTTPGGFREEKNYHAIFIEDHHRGEWFRISQQIIDELQRLGIAVSM